MLYLDDRLPTHPKILKAGARLGPGGASSALHLYMLGLTYATVHLTDGFLPCSFVSSCGVVSKSSLVANVLSARGIGLWRKVRGGYVIHDFQKHNPKAAVIKAKRERDRLRKAAERAERAGRNGNLSMVDNARTRARVCTKVPCTKRIGADTDPKSTSTGARRLALARGHETPSFALACVVMREALDQAATVDHDTGIATAGEYFKTFCARRGLAYDADLVRKAYDAVTVTQRRRA
jgi:hypothetical protein